MKDIIDSRVVEMRFDNKQFESGAKETMSTLGRLKEALKLPNTTKALEGIDKATRNISLDGIASGVQALQERFSTFGIVGMRVIQNVTDGLMSKLGAAVNFVTDSIVSGGVKRAMNIENAHFQLQALLKDETKVQAVMADAMESVDGTAYAYDEAAKAASQFAASGIQAGDEMLNALKGITGVAAMTNSSFEEVSMIFTTVAGNGRLMGDQLLQLSSRGLNAASTLANYFQEVRGQANMTEMDIRDLVSKGKISFKDFSDAMTWAFGDSAKRANETFTGALSNMKSALARIGAGFVSPLVEQNGELVQLFNALRIKINDVKSALVFDEQKSAISGMSKEAKVMVDTMSRFVKDGTIGFDEITTKIIGANKTEEELNAANEKLSESYEKIKEAGYASSDALVEFNQNGISAAKAVHQYLNGVLDGTIKVSDGVKQSVQELTGGVKVNALEVMQLAEEGKISYDIFTDAIVNSSGAIKDSSELTTKTVERMMASVKESGEITSKTLVEFNKNGLNAARAVKEYINGVTDGSIRASYATKQAIEGITEGSKLASGEVIRLADEGKISYDILQSAMENMYGDQKTLSKQFTDFVQDQLSDINKAINAADMTKPMEVFYFWAESAKNALKGLFSVLSPVGKAFAEVFLSFDGDSILSFSESVEELTSKMKLSEEGSKDLHDAFKGMFDLLKLGTDIFFELLGAIVPINKPIVEMGDGFIGLAGSMGRALTEFTKVVRSSTTLRRAFGVLSTGFSGTMDALSKLIKIIKRFGSSIYNLSGTQKLLNSINKAFEKLHTKASPYVDGFIDDLESLLKSLFKIEDLNVDSVLDDVSDAFSKLADSIDGFSFDDISKAFDKLKEKIQGFLKFFTSNEGVNVFVENFASFDKDLAKEIFSLEGLLSRLEKVMSVFSKFFNWIRSTFSETFADFNLGSTVAAAGGLGIIYSLIKASKALENVSQVTKTLGGIPKVLDGVRGALVSYQKELKAETLLKTAEAIAVLAGALVLLSFVKPDRLIPAALALSAIAGVFLFGLSRLTEAANKGREVSAAINTFARGFSSAIKKLGRAVEIKAIGSSIKDIGKTILLIAGSIVAIGFMWRKDPKAFEEAIYTIQWIAKVLAAMGIVMYAGANLGNTRGMTKIAQSVLMISASLLLVVGSIKKLMGIDLPEDYGLKLGILGGIIAGLGVLAVVLSGAAKLAGGNQLPKMASTIRSLAVLLFATVLSMKALFNMDLPADYKTKLGILAGIFGGFAVLVLAMGAAARISKGQGFKAAATIMAMAAFLVVVVASLFVLTILPADKMLKGAVALGGILMALALALVGAGVVSDKNAAKAVMAMAVTVGVITAALAVLSIIPANKLLKGAVALGAVLLVLAENFREVAKIKSKNALPAILAMIAATLTITVSLVALASQPWEGLLAAAGSMSVTLLAFSKSFEMILGKRWSENNVKKIGTFLLMTLAVIPIGVALGVLANQPWEGLLAAGISLSAVLAVLSGCFVLIAKTKVDLTAIASVVAGSASLLLVAGAISMLAQYDGDQLLASCLALSAILLVMVGVMAACSLLSASIGPAMAGVLGLGAVIAELAIILAAIGGLAQIPGLKWLIDEGGDLLQQVGEAIGKFVGGIIGGGMTAIASQLPEIGTYLSQFMENLKPFIEGSGMLDAQSVACVGFLAAIIVALTAAEFLNGIASLFGLSLVDVAVELSDFMDNLKPFINGSKQLKEENARACQYIASMIITLTAAEIISGVGRILGLGGKLSEFGEELSKFGPYIKKFADQVKDVNPEAVQGAAAAGEIMADLARKLPATGGFAQKIFGTKSLSEFGKELVLFGPSIASFAIIVKDIKPEAVQGAAAAGEIMAGLSEKLPTTGGLAQKIFGTKSLSEFGKELLIFGPSIKEFAVTVKDINPTSVLGAASAAGIMATLAEKLPNSETLWNKIFGGGTSTLSDFGNEIVSFGMSMFNFSETIKDVNTLKVASVVESFQQLLDLSNNIGESSGSNIADFSKSLSKIAVDGLDKFVEAFENAGPRAETAVGTLMTAVTSAMTTNSSNIGQTAAKVGANLCSGLRDGILQNQGGVISAENSLTVSMVNTIRNSLPVGTFSTVGQNVIQGLINGINAKKPLTLSTVKNLCIAIINQFRISLPPSTFNTIGQSVIQALINGMLAKRPAALSSVRSICFAIINEFRSELPDNTFYSIGQRIIISLINGMESQKGSAKTAARNMCSEIEQAFRDNMSYSEFRDIGENAANGLRDGIESKIGEIASAATNAAMTAAKAARQGLQERSPSRVTRKIGENFDLGLVIGILSLFSRIAQAGKQAADEAVEPVKDGMSNIRSIINSSDLNLDPVIRPVMDLSDIRNGVNEINSMMQRTYDLSDLYNRAMDVSATFNRKNTGKIVNDTQNAVNPEPSVSNVFNQYNYSPKALSRSEIYRQTNNQFSAFRRAVNPV